MKKLIAFLLAAIMLLSLCACGGSGDTNTTAPENTDKLTDGTEMPALASAESLLNNAEAVLIDNLCGQFKSNKAKAQSLIGQNVVLFSADPFNYVETVETDHCVLGGKHYGSMFYIRAFLSTDELITIEGHDGLNVVGTIADYGETEFDDAFGAVTQTYVDLNPAFIVPDEALGDYPSVQDLTYRAAAQEYIDNDNDELFKAEWETLKHNDEFLTEQVLSEDELKEIIVGEWDSYFGIVETFTEDGQSHYINGNKESDRSYSIKDGAVVIDYGSTTSEFLVYPFIDDYYIFLYISSGAPELYRRVSK